MITNSTKNNENSEENHSKRKHVESQNTDDYVEMVKPLVTTFLNTNFPTEGKISCLSAIYSLMTKDPKVCEFLAKKEIIEEITNLAEKVENEAKDLNVVAKVLSKLNGFEQGKELFGKIRMPIAIYEKLRTEMKRFEVSKNPEDFAFNSEENSSKKIKIENVKIDLE